MKREWLIQIRRSRGLTQEKVAASAFIDRGYYSQIENGKRNPGANVIFNIAKALDFDPIKFYEHQFEDTTSTNEISECFTSMNRGTILHLYNDVESYFQNIIIFLLSGVEQNSLCLVIDDNENLNRIQQNVAASLSINEKTTNIFFINREMNECEPEEIVNDFQMLQAQFQMKKSIRIWLSEKKYQNDWLAKIESDFNIENDEMNENILFELVLNGV